MQLKKLITFLFLSGSIVLALGQDIAMKTRYTSPAISWEKEVLPIGNGHIGGMVFSGVDVDVILVNEKTLWWWGGPGKNPEYNGGHTRTAVENHESLQSIRNTLQEKMLVFHCFKISQKR